MRHAFASELERILSNKTALGGRNVVAAVAATASSSSPSSPSSSSSSSQPSSLCCSEEKQHGGGEEAWRAVVTVAALSGDIQFSDVIERVKLKLITMSGSNDDSIENSIDFGGRFARQFFNDSWQHLEQPQVTSTPVAQPDVHNDSGYPESPFQAVDINNNESTISKLSAGINLMKIMMTTDVKQRSNSLFTTMPASLWSTPDITYQRFNNVDKIERAASLHRTAASYSEPQYTWSGQLPSRSYKNPVYSCKVFLGGVPWDVTEQGLIETFGRFGPLRVQWPGNARQSGQTKAGYVYLIYESERYVKALLQACTQDFGSGTHPEKYFYQLSSRRMRYKEVQVIPWILADSNYIRNQSGRPDMHRTVFVGALHGMLTAEGLARIMNDLFGGVAYVGIDSDKYKYPIGSGRVAFHSQRSYMKAVSAAFIEVKSSQFCKKIQVDPYLESSDCSVCHIQNGPIYCRDCFRYFCKTCWTWHHSSEPITGKQHRPLMRKKRET